RRAWPWRGRSPRRPSLASDPSPCAASPITSRGSAGRSPTRPPSATRREGSGLMAPAGARRRGLFCIPQLDRAGPDAVYFNLLRTLDLDHFEPFLVVTKPTGAYLDELPDHIPVLRTDERRYPVRSVVEHVRAVRPDVVLATLRMSFTCTAARPFFPRHTNF